MGVVNVNLQVTVRDDETSRTQTTFRLDVDVPPAAAQKITALVMDYLASDAQAQMLPPPIDPGF
jgi:hypothetical protein